MVFYIVGISVGAFLFSIVLIAMLSLSVVLDKTAKSRTYIVQKISKMKVAVMKAAPKIPFKSTPSDPPGTGGNNHEEGTAEAAAVAASAENGAGERSDSEKSVQVLELAPEPHHFQFHGVLWACLAVALYIAGLICAAIGIAQLFTNSIVSNALVVLAVTTVAKALEALMCTGLGLIGLCDILVVSFNHLGRGSSLHTMMHADACVSHRTHVTSACRLSHSSSSSPRS